jgi:hypothetical protein
MKHGGRTLGNGGETGMSTLTDPGSMILSGVLVAVWIGLLSAGRTPGARFFFISGGAALAAMALAYFVVASGTGPENCDPLEMCFSIRGMQILDNAILAIPTIVGLFIATMVGAMVRSER